MSAATAPEKSKFGLAKVALGLALASGTLSGCGTPVPPAADAGAYELEDVEVVVLSDSIDRIDIARETHEVCTGSGDDESCHETDDPYHPIGLHLGHGVVQDLNGNLFAAPQLAADQAPGRAVANPDSVFVDGPLFTEGHLNRTGAGSFDIEGSVFSGDYTIDLDGKSAVVTSRALFGGRYESMRISHVDGTSTISEGRWDQEIVQSQGEHLLVQGTHGAKLAEIRQDREAGSYSLTQDVLFGNDTVITATYGPERYGRSSNRWGGGRFRVEKNSSKQDVVTINRGSPDYTITPMGQGWSQKNHGFFGGSSDLYQVTGGVTLPKN